MKQKYSLFLCITCLFLALLLALAINRQKEEALALRIAPEILRFHVLANSDSQKDQALKLKVRNLLLNSIYDDLGENASLEETKSYVISHREELEEKAESYMKELGYDYPAHMELTNCYFPAKAYGDLIFPCGSYDAVRVKIGKGKGHNWWCVLYPPLCFVDASYAVVPETSKEILLHSLNQKDYEKLLAKEPKVRIRFKLAELISESKPATALK